VQERDTALAKAEKAEERCSWWTWPQAALMVMFLSYTFAMWYASIHLADYGASGGSIISVFFTVLMVACKSQSIQFLPFMD
jgi:hypothetical protein